MIDIETKNERDLKNIRQIGMPTQEDKIYIENAVYARIHEEDYAGEIKDREVEEVEFIQDAILGEILWQTLKKK